jgi:hypothetical protein
MLLASPIIVLRKLCLHVTETAAARQQLVRNVGAMEECFSFATVMTQFLPLRIKRKSASTVHLRPHTQTDQGGVHSPSYMSPPPGRTCKRL